MPSSCDDVRGELALRARLVPLPRRRAADVLHDVNLRLAPGETVALVGATGSGKTIFTNLVARLWDVTGGRITLDGVDVRDLRLDRLRQLVATAFEDPVLFSMSARENIALGRPDASDAEIDEASRSRRRSSCTSCPSASTPGSASRA